jgi:molybdopterin/thiamine biosynthesis adenylyltransferase
LGSPLPGEDLASLVEKPAEATTAKGARTLLELTEWELEKYKRQIQIPGFGVEAQQKLKSATALVTRIGGLGGPAAVWLAAAGIGRLIVAHGGTLTPSNLNRRS